MAAAAASAALLAAVPSLDTETCEYLSGVLGEMAIDGAECALSPELVEEFVGPFLEEAPPETDAAALFGVLAQIFGGAAQQPEIEPTAADECAEAQSERVAKLGAGPKPVGVRIGDIQANADISVGSAGGEMRSDGSAAVNALIDTTAAEATEDFLPLALTAQGSHSKKSGRNQGRKQERGDSAAGGSRGGGAGSAAVSKAELSRWRTLVLPLQRLAWVGMPLLPVDLLEMVASMLPRKRARSEKIVGGRLALEGWAWRSFQLPALGPAAGSDAGGGGDAAAERARLQAQSQAEVDDLDDLASAWKVATPPPLPLHLVVIRRSPADPRCNPAVHGRSDRRRGRAGVHRRRRARAGAPGAGGATAAAAGSGTGRWSRRETSSCTT